MLQMEKRVRERFAGITPIFADTPIVLNSEYAELELRSSPETFPAYLVFSLSKFKVSGDYIDVFKTLVEFSQQGKLSDHIFLIANANNHVYLNGSIQGIDSNNLVSYLIKMWSHNHMGQPKYVLYSDTQALFGQGW